MAGAGATTVVGEKRRGVIPRDHLVAADTLVSSHLPVGSGMGRSGMGRVSSDATNSRLLTPVPGQIVGLVGNPGYGLTRLGLSMIAPAATCGPVAYVDVRGWMSPTAAWEVGIDPERLVVVRCDDPATWQATWGRVVTGLLDGMQAVFAEVPRNANEAHLRTLAAVVRRRRIPLLLRPVHGALPSGLAYLRLEAREISWEGTDAGHGRLSARRLTLEASGKAVRGMTRIIEVEDHGEDAVRLVPGLGAATPGRATG